ncbi:MAG: aminoacyl-tRNA hydrolase [Fimbriimonas sp.]|nr:aminoacyl-tRNA hydrolase [Fimbriimonas sp.]
MFFKRSSKPAVPPEWIVVGLGNPGGEYRGTRHNVGFEVIDLLVERHKIKLDRSKHSARYGIGTIEDVAVLLIKPLTYMNLSGRAVAPFARDFNLKPDRILVLADDLDLRLGRLRLKPGGSAGGHNGHKSLIASLGTSEYPRLKIGIGSTSGETIDHVLGAFDRDERPVIDIAIQRSADGVEAVVGRGLAAGMNLVNTG